MQIDDAHRAAQPSRVLLADSDLQVLHVTNSALCAAGLVVATAGDAEAALSLLDRQRFDLLVLDAAMFGADGLAVCTAIRGRVRTPVIVSSANGTEADIVRALNLGADDYVTKPLKQRTLLARIHAILRRSVADDTTVLKIDGVALDVQSQALKSTENAVSLTRLETSLLRALLASPGRAVGAKRLAVDLWGKESAEQRHALKQVVYRLRGKLERQAVFAGRLQTSRNAGYRWRKDGEVR